MPNDSPGGSPAPSVAVTAIVPRINAAVTSSITSSHTNFLTKYLSAHRPSLVKLFSAEVRINLRKRRRAIVRAVERMVLTLLKANQGKPWDAKQRD